MVVAPVAQKPSVEMRQAPVPLLVKARPAINLPASDDKAAGTKATETKSGDTPAEASTDDAAAEKAAARAIEADGYKGVKVLRKGADGVWHASALRGKTTVMLTVDANGSVTSD
jgi:L-alanine-DL-glutamate epimerase-like enolase superfamily enzyme